MENKMNPLDIVSMLGSGISSLVNLGEGIKASKAQKEAQKNQLAAINNATSIANDQLQLYKSQLNDWEAAFGSIQNNLSEYYKSLDPTILASNHIQNIEEEYKRASDNINAELTRRGLDTSGASVAANTQLQRGLAESRAEAKYKAPQEVAMMQQGYLQGVGLPQQNSIMSGLNQGFSGLQNAYYNQANMYGQQAAMVGKQAASGMAGFGQAILGGIGNAVVSNAIGSNNQSSPNLAPTIQSTQPTQGLGIMKNSDNKWSLKKSWLANYTGGTNG